jgi:hypothetical protein
MQEHPVFGMNVWNAFCKSNKVGSWKSLKGKESSAKTRLGPKSWQSYFREQDGCPETNFNNEMSLKEQVEASLPNWESWYPSLFHAAEDLGLIRARVCSPSSLLLSNRHSGVQDAARNAYIEKWGGKE